jgi:SAM-dependent methyltransferase
MSDSGLPASPWDERYAEPGWAFGREPNDFLREHATLLPPGRVLCLAEGEGRNAVHLATLGYEVTGVDLSPVGLAKAQALASERGVRITTVHADLAGWTIEPASWQGIVSIFAHVPEPVRVPLHRAVVAGLAPGGVLLLEAYTPAQVGRGTGGPSDAERLMTLESLRRELDGLEWNIAREIEREIFEGRCHGGTSAVVQVAARKPG